MFLVALVGTTGCSASQSPGASTAQQLTSGQPSPALSESPEAEAVVLLVHGNGFDLVSDDEIVFEHVWSDAAEPAVDALEKAFGALPVESESAGDGTHSGPTAIYTWENFVFTSALGLSEEEREGYFFSSGVVLTGTESHDVLLSTRSGINVGMSIAEVEAIGVQRTVEMVHAPEFGIFFYFDSPNESGLDDGTSNAVRAETGQDRSNVVTISAPATPFL
jgi:hypothetical protein